MGSEEGVGGGTKSEGTLDFLGMEQVVRTPSGSATTVTSLKVAFTALAARANFFGCLVSCFETGTPLSKRAVGGTKQLGSLSYRGPMIMVASP